MEGARVIPYVWIWVYLASRPPNSWRHEQICALEPSVLIADQVTSAAEAIIGEALHCYASTATIDRDARLVQAVEPIAGGDAVGASLDVVEVPPALITARIDRGMSFLGRRMRPPPSHI